MSDIEEPPGYAERDDSPTSEQTGGGVPDEGVPPPDQGADWDEVDGDEDADDED